jgi:hypothetical protein
MVGLTFLGVLARDKHSGLLHKDVKIKNMAGIALNKDTFSSNTLWFNKYCEQALSEKQHSFKSVYSMMPLMETQHPLI